MAAPSGYMRYLEPAALRREGFPIIDDPRDPCWSLAAAGWPGLTAEEACMIAEKTRPIEGYQV